jgi:hypothetical protein
MSGIALYLWRMFRWSSRRRFFWAIAAAFASIAIEHVSAEIKNLAQPAPVDVAIAWQWLAGRIQESIIAGFVLGYLVFGQNGKPKTSS